MKLYRAFLVARKRGDEGAVLWRREKVWREGVG